MKSCGEVTVYPGRIGLALRATCENGVIIDTFAKGFPCPFHEEEVLVNGRTQGMSQSDAVGFTR